MDTWNVFRSENRAGGYTQHVGMVNAPDEEAAQDEAAAQFDCLRTHHLWVQPADGILQKIEHAKARPVS